MIVRLALRGALILASVAGALASFFVVLLGLFGGGIIWLVLAVAMFGHAYACGATCQHLRDGDDEPWTLVALGLLGIAIVAVLIYKFIL